MNQRPAQRPVDRVVDGICHQNCPAWDQAATQCFREHNDIWVGRVVKSRQKLACPEETGLHFIEHKQRSVALAKIARVGQIVLRGQPNAASP
jgi:hypothetical protein